MAMKMQQLSDVLSQLNINHTIWVAKAGFTEEELQAEMYSVNWLESEWVEVDDLQDQIDALNPSTTPRTTHTEADSITIALGHIETLKSDIVTKLTQLLQKTISTPETPFSCSSSRLSAYKESLTILH